MNRRQFLAVGAGTATIPLAGCTDDNTASASELEGNPDIEYLPPDMEPDYEGHFEQAHDTFEETHDEQTVDWRGESTVSVAVSNDLDVNKFDPAAIAVSPDTTVEWEHFYRGHNVVLIDSASITAADYPAIGNEDLGQAGDTYTDTFVDPGVYLFECTPHVPGMVAAVYVTE